MPTPDRGLIARVTRAFARLRREAEPPVEKSSSTGTPSAEYLKWTSRLFAVSSERSKAYADLEEMDDTVDEVATALDILADCAVSAEDGQTAFTVQFPDDQEIPQRAKDAIAALLDETHLQEESYKIARSTLKYGDQFLQVVVDRQTMQICRIVPMPVRSMKRNEDEAGLLQQGDRQGAWAFEQYRIGTSAFIAGFYDWQIVHLRWSRPENSIYGRGVFYSTRNAWKKLKAMEEALAINWLTRAFARLLFKIDTTGMSDKEARAHVRRFRQALLTKKLASGTLSDDPLTVIRDIYLPVAYNILEDGSKERSLDDVTVLDTANTGFKNLESLEYFRSKLLMRSRVPRAYLGLERDVNARATLEQEERQFARTERRVQAMLTAGLIQIIDLQLILAGIDPKTIPYALVWPNPLQPTTRLRGY